MEERPSEDRHPLRCAIGACAGCGCFALVVAAVIVGGVLLLRQAAADAARAHVAAVREGRLDEAYAETSDAFRARVSRERFEAFVAANPGLYEAADLRFERRRIHDDQATLDGTPEGTQPPVPVRFVLVHERGAWRVHHVEVEPGEGDGSGAPPGEAEADR